MQSTCTLRFRTGFQAIRHRHTSLGRFGDPAALLAALHTRGGCADDKNGILTALVAAAQDESPAADTALTLMLLALWPGLDAIRGRVLRRGIALRDEAGADILGRATEAVRGLDLARVSRIAATILRNIQRDMIRAQRREADRQCLTADIDPDALVDDRGGAEQAVGRARLQDDIRRLAGADAVLVIRVAVEGCTQAEAAAEVGLSEAAGRKRYQRAWARVRRALQENCDADVPN